MCTLLRSPSFAGHSKLNLSVPPSIQQYLTPLIPVSSGELNNVLHTSSLIHFKECCLQILEELL